MPVIRRAPALFKWLGSTDNLEGTTPTIVGGAGLGTNFTQGANNADGAVVTLLSALSHDVHEIIIAFRAMGLSTAAPNSLATIVYDPAGGTSWTTLFDQLLCGGDATGDEPQKRYQFPYFIPSGASIGIKARTAHTADITTGRACLWVRGNPNRKDVRWFGRNIEIVGVTASTSKGTDVVPGNSGAWGSWTSIGSTTANRWGAIQLGLGGTTATATNNAYHFQIGVGSAKLTGSPTIHAQITATEQEYGTGWVDIPCDIPAGTQLQVRATSDTGTPQTWDVGLYGVYA